MAGYYFESNRLGFRQWEKKDFEFFAAMNQDETVMRYMPKTLGIKDSQKFFDRLQAHFKTYGYGLYAVEIKTTKTLIGYIGLSHPTFKADFTPCVEIGWRLNGMYWNRGYATEGAKACLMYAFDVLGLTRIVSFTSKINTPSIAVMKKIGLGFSYDFKMPTLKAHHPLASHVLYSIKRHNTLYFHTTIGEAYDPKKPIGRRESVRGVIIKQRKILLVKTNRGDYMIPGGGIDKGESFEEALKREIQEETGYPCESVGDYFGKMIHRKVDRYDARRLYEITSHYFLCSVSENFVGQSLIRSEKVLGFEPVWMPIEEAILQNKRYQEALKDQDFWVACMNFVLEQARELV